MDPWLPCQRTGVTIQPERPLRLANPLKIDGKQPEPPQQGAGRQDYATGEPTP